MYTDFSPYPIERFPHPVPATVEKEIRPHTPGRVRIHSRSWPARLEGCDTLEITLTAGSQVLIYGRRGNHLLVSAN